MGAIRYARRVATDSDDDAETRATRELAARLGALRARVLVPWSFTALAGVGGAYLVLRDLQLTHVGVHGPPLTGGAAGALGFAWLSVGYAVQRTLRERALDRWLPELGRKHGVEPTRLRELAAIFT